MTSHFNVIKKFGQKVSKQGEVDYDKQTDIAKKPWKKKWANMNSYEWNKSGGIGTLKWYLIHDILKWPPNLTMCDVIILRVDYEKYKYSPYWNLLNIRDNYF